MARKTSYYKDETIEKMIEQQEETKNEQDDSKEPEKKVIVLSEKQIEESAPKTEPTKITKKETKVMEFSGFFTFEENYKEISNLLKSGWKIVKEEKTTTDHKIILEK